MQAFSAGCNAVSCSFDCAAHGLANLNLKVKIEMSLRYHFSRKHLDSSVVFAEACAIPALWLKKCH